MEMQTGGLILKEIQYIDDDTISHRSRNVGYRPLIVDSNDKSREHAIRIGSDPGNVEIIYNGSSMGEYSTA